MTSCGYAQTLYLKLIDEESGTICNDRMLLDRFVMFEILLWGNLDKLNRGSF